MRPARGPKNAGMGHPCQCATRQPQSSRPTRSFKEEALTLRLFRSLRDLRVLTHLELTDHAQARSADAQHNFVAVQDVLEIC